jgi:hypothetical protein
MDMKNWINEVFMIEFYPKLGKRANAFKMMFEHLISLNKGFYTIVETGSMREKNNWLGDGQSTIMFARFCKDQGSSEFYSVDIDPEAIEFAKDHFDVDDTKFYGIDQPVFICGDSVKFLYEYAGYEPFNQDIDLLYLDSFDVDFKNPVPSALHHLKELTAIWSRVNENGLVVVDDNMHGKGKGMFVKEFFKSLNIKPFFDEYQIGFIKQPFGSVKSEFF